MKQTFALLLAIAVLTTTNFTAFAATKVATYPVGDVSSKAYLVDDDDEYVDLTESVSRVAYGETAYYPLLNKGSVSTSEALSEYNAAKNAYSTAEETYKNKEAACSKALTDYNDAKKADDDAQGVINNLGTLAKAVEDAKTALAAAKLAQSAAPTAADITNSEIARTTAKNNYDTAVTNGLDSGSIEALRVLMVNTQAAYDKAVDDKGKADALVTKREGELATANKNLANASSLSAAQATKATTALNLTTAAEKKTTAEGEKNAASTALATALTNRTNKENAYNAALSAASYLYVNESEAIDNVKFTKKWEENGNYVDGVDIVKKRVSADSTVKGSTSRYLYFLAIEIKSNSSTAERDLFGTITIKKSGTNGFDIPTDISLELGYSSASKSEGEGVIPITPATFKEGDGFESESKYRFDFKADSKSSFVVSTVGQGSIVLSLNTDPIDKIYNKYPDADLEFFNGNYASFNRVGTLYLGYKDDDAYVYSISKSGELSRVDADWDDDEDAYAISTRTLGRYVISDTKLKVTSTSTSSSSSSASSGTGAITSGSGTTPVIPSASSVPSYTYTPPVASSSSKAPVQSSSSSESSSESEEMESELEDEDEDEDDIVSVDIDDDDSEGPEEKSGIAGWVWALLIVGLAAVPVTIGVVYYIHGKPIRRDFFKSHDNDNDDNNDDNDDKYDE